MKTACVLELHFLRVKSFCVKSERRTLCSGQWYLYKSCGGPLQPRGSFSVISRCLRITWRCHVPLSVALGPPVTSRASHISVSWPVVASSVLVEVVMPAVRVVLDPAPAVRVCVASFIVSPPICHPVRPREETNHKASKNSKLLRIEKWRGNAMQTFCGDCDC